MNTKLILAGVLTSAMTLGAAASLADERTDCTSAPRSEWRTLNDAMAAVTAMGYDVRGAEREGNCYEVKALDKEGYRVEMYFDPATLKMVLKKRK